MVAVDDDAVTDHGSQPVKKCAETLTESRLQLFLGGVRVFAKQMS